MKTALVCGENTWLISRLPPETIFSYWQQSRIKAFMYAENRIIQRESSTLMNEKGLEHRLTNQQVHFPHGSELDTWQGRSAWSM